MKPQPYLPHPRYRPDIDGLRAIAILSVVMFHALPGWLRGGFTGVDVFFVISGFLISKIILENLERGAFSLKEFYARRIRRIFPALILVLAVSLALGWFALLGDEYMRLGKHATGAAGFVANLVQCSELGYFHNSSQSNPLLHLWSLGVEEQFYIIWPLLLWAAWKRKLNLLTLILALILASFYMNLRQTRNGAICAFYSPEARFWELLCGAALAWLDVFKNNGWKSIRPKIIHGISAVVYAKAAINEKTAANLLSFAGAVLLAYGFCNIRQDYTFPGFWAAVPVLGAAGLIAAGPQAWLNRVILSSPPAVWLGLVSYPLYLWHWPLLYYARIIANGAPGTMARMAAMLLAVLLAWLTYKFVESPIRRGPPGRSMIATLLALMLLAGSAGYAIYRGEGFISQRFDKSQHRLLESALPRNSSDYTPQRLSALEYKPFDPHDTRPKIMIIGDSYAEDLANALYEASLAQELQLSAKYMKKECGSLFLQPQMFIEHAPARSRNRCARKSIYKDTRLRSLMHEADEVWYASSWEEWQAGLIAGSVHTTHAFTGKPVRVFGNKHVGNINFRKLLKLSANARRQGQDQPGDSAARRVLNHVPKSKIAINRAIEDNLEKDVFINVQQLLCGNDPHICAPFTADNDLISYDGTHLTPQGARFYGKKLRSHPAVQYLWTKRR